MTAMDKLRRALVALDATPRGYGSLARAVEADAVIAAARAVVRDADRSPYPVRVLPPLRPSLSEDDGA